MCASPAGAVDADVLAWDAQVVGELTGGGEC